MAVNGNAAGHLPGLDTAEANHMYSYCVSEHYSLSCFYLKHTFWRLDSVSIFRWKLLS
jgi:hypothetical protein